MKCWFTPQDVTLNTTSLPLAPLTDLSWWTEQCGEWMMQYPWLPVWQLFQGESFRLYLVPNHLYVYDSPVMWRWIKTVHKSWPPVNANHKAIGSDRTCKLRIAASYLITLIYFYLFCMTYYSFMYLYLTFFCYYV